MWIVENKQLAERTVQVGLRNWDYVEVLNGIKEGDPVVTSLDRTDIQDGHPVQGVEESAI